MRLKTDWDEPQALASLEPLHPEAEPVAPGPAQTALADEPPLDASVGWAATAMDGRTKVGKRSHKATVWVLLLVLVLHLAGFWLLAHRPEHPIEPSGGRPYQASLVNAQALAPQVNQGHAQQAAKAIAAARAQAEQVRAQRQQRARAAQHAAQQRTAQRRQQAARQQAARRASQASRSSRSEARSAAQAARGGGQRAPSARQLMNEVVSQASSSGWSQAADRFAQGPSSNAQRNAIERYIAYFTRVVQTYIDMNLHGTASGNAQMELGIRIGRDGHLRQVSVIQSTGRGDLDRLAVKTIHEAGPFRPFDPEMGRLPELNFKRTWVFGEGSGFRFN